MRQKFSYQLKYSGVNFSNFLNQLLKNNIQIYNIKTISNKEYVFSINNKNYKKYNKTLKSDNVSVIKNGGLKNFILGLLRRVGLFVGVLVTIFYSIIINKYTMGIRVEGAELIKEDIINNVKNFGIEIGKINNFKNEDLECYLLDNVSNLSFVSIKKQGNIIIINAIEKENNCDVYNAFYSPYNMVIRDIKLISGTLNIDKNSVVKKGSILVEPYTISSNGERISVPAKAEIIADVWFCGSETVLKETINYVPTNEQTTYKLISFIKNKKHDKMSPYKDYMTETIVYNATNSHFIPIFLTKTTYYKTEKKIEFFDYEKNKDIYLEKSKQNAYTILPKNVTINEMKQSVSDLSDRYIFQTYLKTTMEISNED